MELKIAYTLFIIIGVLAIVGLLMSFVLIINLYLDYQKEQKRKKQKGRLFHG